MDNKAIFVRTSKGEDEAHSKTTHLAGDVKRALLMVDGTATFGEISKRVAPSLRANLDALFQELEKGGFVQDTTKVHTAPKISTPPKMSAPLKMAAPQKAQTVDDDDGGELDFMSGFSATPPQSQTADAHKAAANTAKLKAEAEAKAKQELEAAKLKAQQEAEAKAKQELEAAKLKAQQEAEAKAKRELEAAKLKAQQEAEAKAKHELEAAKLKAQQEAEAKAKRELEAAKLKAQQEAEAKAKQELEAAKLKAQQEAEAKAKQELEAAKLKAQQEAAAILHQAEQEAARLREESARRAKAEEAARLKAEQEASRLKAQQEAEAKAKRELEEAKLKAQQEAEAKARQEREEAELKAQQEADAKARREREEAKIKAQQEAAAILHKAEQEAARLREESARRAKAEEEAARLKAEQEALRLHEEMAAARLKAEHEEKLRLEAVARERQQAEAARIKAEREAAEMQAELEAAKTRAELEAKARLEAETRALARMKAEEEKAAHIAAEHIAKEQQAAQAHAATLASQQAAFQPALGAAEVAPAGKPGAFAFDAFQVDAPPTHASHSDQSAGHAEAPGTAHAKKPDSFSFDSFQVDAPQLAVEAQKNQVPDHQTAPAQHPSDAPRHTLEQPVPPPATDKPAEHKPEHEQPKRAEPEHIAAEERIAAEAQAKKLADEQAKVWAEAEQRALEAAKTNAERVLHQPEQHAAEKTPVAPIARVSRKPFAWGKLAGLMLKLGIVLLVLLVAALFAVPYFMPMRDYMPKVEKMLSERINQPVHIGYLSGRILPTPRLDLGEVYIGEVKQFQAAQAQLNFAFSGLFDEKKPIDSVVMQNVKVSGKGLQNVSAWLQKLAANGQFPVGRMVISQGTLDADAFELAGIEGEINFNPASKFTQANLRANSGKYTLGINVTPEDKLQIAISVRGSALPLLPNWVFDDLNAKGELNNNELIISDYDARIAEGALQGNASINWRSGWRAQGTLTAKTIAMKQLNSLLDGNVAGLAHFKMTSSDLAGLTNSAVLDGNFTASGGTINGMDIVETARLKSKDHLPGGRTHFKDFSGAIAFANNAYHFRQVKITTDVLNASAELDIEKRQLSGSINARLSIQEGMGPVDLKIGGMIDSPWLRAAR